MVLAKHRVSSTNDLNEFPLPNNEQLIFDFELMYGYTDWVAKDFADNNNELAAGKCRAAMRGVLAS